MPARSVKPNYALDVANAFIANLGAPELASVDRLLASTNMLVGAYAVANGGVSADGLARNVTVTATAAGGADTMGTLLITGTNTQGRTISETLIPAAGSTVAGAKAFKTVTAIVGAGWVISAGNDTLEVGFGNLIGLPAAIRQQPAVSAAAQVAPVILGTAIVAATVLLDADEIEKCTIDASAATYDGTKKLSAFITR